ncbi:hypothetical protein [Streptomyces sp. Ac-502]|uniref:hypothetical protein n=1 Tax=Streptomyces sp. Ac-502 TaxID=3342801 RepID=UPI003862787B
MNISNSAHRSPTGDAIAAAHHLLTDITVSAAPGRHTLLLSVPAPDGTPKIREGEFSVSPTEFATINAIAAVRYLLATALRDVATAGLVMRSEHLTGPSTVRGWVLHDGLFRPLTQGEVFTAYTTDCMTGEVIPAEPGMSYQAGFPVSTASLAIGLSADGHPTGLPTLASDYRMLLRQAGKPEVRCPVTQAHMLSDLSLLLPGDDTRAYTRGQVIHVETDIEDLPYAEVIYAPVTP